MGGEKGKNSNAGVRASFLRCHMLSFCIVRPSPVEIASSSVIYDNLARLANQGRTLHDEGDFYPKPVKSELFGFQNAHSKHPKHGISVVNLCCSLVSSSITSTILQNLSTCAKLCI